MHIKYLNIKNILSKELSVFQNLGQSCRKLVISNFVFSFVFLILPIIANYFIYKEFEEFHPEEIIKYTITYFIGYYLAIPIGFIINGLLLQIIKINYLYIIGMIFEVFVIIPLFFMHLNSHLLLFLVGTVMGISIALYWGNRHYMTLFVTENNNRNYVLGLENTLMTLAGLISPLIFGFLTGDKGMSLNQITKTNSKFGEVILAIFLIAAIIFSASVIIKQKFHNPSLGRFLYLNYGKLWNKQRLINVLEGFTNGTLIVMPSIIILNIINDSGKLGLLQSIGTAVALAPIYFLARITKPHHRATIIVWAGIVLAIGSATIAIGFNEIAASVFILAGNIVFTVLYMPYLAVRMRSINLTNQIQRKEEYGYFVDIEIALAIGRLLGLGVFLLFYYWSSQVFALRFGFLIISIIPFVSAFILRSIKQE